MAELCTEKAEKKHNQILPTNGIFNTISLDGGIEPSVNGSNKFFCNSGGRDLQLEEVIPNSTLSVHNQLSVSIDPKGVLQNEEKNSSDEKSRIDNSNKFEDEKTVNNKPNESRECENDQLCLNFIKQVRRQYFSDKDETSMGPLDRVYKVVFIGDSAVGKTCFLDKYCYNRFKSVFNTTIGVDFTVKQIEIAPGISVAVQLWDTAGQERFRSITKQYFRRADGVVLMYDVTSEESFLNVRSWIESVKVGVNDGCVLCLIGNKCDLHPNAECRTVTYKHGKDLAREFDMLFFRIECLYRSRHK